MKASCEACSWTYVGPSYGADPALRAHQEKDHRVALAASPVRGLEDVWVKVKRYGPGEDCGCRYVCRGVCL